jgi:aminoglycoside phosphotransferase (APT) family kinase protein
MKHRLPETIPEIHEELSWRLVGSRSAHWERVRAGVSTRVYRITHGGGHSYLRILPEAGATFAPEVRVHQLARELGCRVPAVLYYEARNEMTGRSLMLTSEIPGKPLAAGDAPEAVREAVRAAGRDLAKINSIRVAGFGWVRRDISTVPETIEAERDTLSKALDADYGRPVAALPDDAVPGIASGVLREAAQRAMRLVEESGESRLAHGDFDTSHIFVDGGRYSGIIDFGEIRGAPAFYDLGHHRMHDAERLPYATLPWLLEGYRELRPLPEHAERQIWAWSVLIAVRALQRGLQRNPASRIVATARRCLLRDANGA